MATIIDVAKKAGVSIKTVSRVMNNQTNVREETRRRVRDAIDDLDYSPSEAARRMRSGKSSAIGMLFSDPRSGYQARLNYSMMHSCSNANRYLAAGLFDESKDDWKEQLVAFLDRTKVENVILVPPMCDSSILQDCLNEREARYVLLSPSRPVPGVSSVSMDDQHAAREMTQHLIDLGHRTIAHISGNPDHIASLLRRQGFDEAMKAAGLGRPDASMVVEGNFNFRMALHQAEKLLARKDRPTAIFAASDDMAAAAYMAAGKLGLHIPEQISIVGFDDVPIAHTIWPSLTTVAQPFDAMARECIRLLKTDPNTNTQSGKAEMIVLPHEIIVRDSCAPPG